MALPVPVAYWPFDNSGADASGNGHDATLVNGTYDTSALKKFGSAALKNTDVSRAASFTPVNLGTVYSVSFWFNGWDGSNDGSVVGGSGGCHIYIDNTYVYHNITGANFVRFQHVPLAMIGSHQIVITRNGTSVTCYRDGSKIDGTYLLTGNVAGVYGSIGGDDNGTLPFVATIDDVRFYNIELTAAQVTELFALVPVAAPSVSAPIYYTPIGVPVDILAGVIYATPGCLVKYSPTATLQFSQTFAGTFTNYVSETPVKLGFIKSATNQTVKAIKINTLKK